MRILLVDDDSATAELMAECLMLDSGVSVQIVGNGREALNTCAAFSPDVVLLDIELPDISGLELAGQLKARCPSARIIVLSGLSTSHGMSNLPLGVEAYLVKPIDFEILLDHILRGRTS